MMKRALMMIPLLLLVGAGCGYEGVPPETVPQDSAKEISALIHGAWKMKDFTASGKEARDVSEIDSTLVIEESTRLSAKICNSMSGEYDIEEDRLKAPMLVSTKMFCQGLPGEIETAFTQDLSSGLKIEFSDEMLVLRSAAGNVFAYEKSENARVGTPNDGEPASQDRAISGTVVSINTDQVPVDGPAIVTIRVSGGVMEKILVPSFGLGLCKAKSSIADVYTLKAGDAVEANGSVGTDGAIVPCQSQAHYLRIVKR